MNYYEFLYKWNMMSFGEGYYFDCAGVPCLKCVCDDRGACTISKYHRKYNYQTNWNRVLDLANELLEEGRLYK